MSAVSHGAMVSHRLANPCKLLRDNRGASIIIALVFLLICAMVSAVVLNFASANAERTNQNAADAQAYEAVASASRFASSGVFASAYGATGLKMTVSTSGAAPAWNVEPTETVGKWVKAQAEKVYAGEATADLANVPITVKNPSTNEDLSAYATYSMQNDYNIKVTVKLQDLTKYAYSITSTTIPKITGMTITDGKITYNYPLIVTWGSNTANAPSYLAGANSLWQQNKDSWSGLSGDKQTQALQAAYFAQYSYELSDYEKSLSSAYTSSYGWKPLVASDGSVILAACSDPTNAGAAKNSKLLYVGGTYYKWADKWGDKSAWVSDNKFDLSTLGVLGTNDAGWRKVS